MRRTLLAIVFGLAAAQPAATQQAEKLTRLQEAYAPPPRDYPAGKDHAQPDTTVPFRWHFYHEGAIETFADAAMLAHVDPYNPLEGEGVRGDPGTSVKWRFVAEHASAGTQALRVDFPADAIRTGKARVHIQGTAGQPTFSEYLRGRLPTASCFGPHYRWIKLDAFNPRDDEVRLRVSGVPLVLRPGRNTIAVKTVDAVERNYQCLFNSIPVELTAPVQDVTLYLDHARMEQEVPATLSRRGRLLQFPGRADPKDPPLLAPGFTAVEVDTLYSPERGFGWTGPKTTRHVHGHSFRSNEHGLLWGCCQSIDAPLRLDLPPGRYGVFVFGAPIGNGFRWSDGMTAKINGRSHVLLPPHSPAEVRQLALGGEAWDYRPGPCVWEALVRRPYYPPFQVVYEEATEGRLLIELPKSLALHALMVFPESDRESALRELGRLNYLLAESWDVSHPWIKGRYAQRSADGFPYIGVHDEMVQPETIPERLRALKLTDADFQRGLVLFERTLTEAIYADTIPTPAEVAFRELRTFAAPGQHVCWTLGILPLEVRSGLQLTVSDLVAGDQRIAAGQIDVRLARLHQKTMQFGHHNHDYNYQEHYLVRRPRLDLYPAAARRAYFDLAVPPGTAPGEYRGSVRIQTADGQTLAQSPLVVEVLPIQLVDPPVYFASSLADPRLKDYGFNSFATSYDDAVTQGYQAYLVNCGHVAVPFRGQRLGWSSFLAHKELLQPIVEAGRAGKGPRGFFGGPAPQAYGNPKAEAVSKEFFDRVRQELPTIDLLGRTMPAFYHGGYKGLQVPHEWIVLADHARPHTAAALEQARAEGQEFWFIDGLRHSKEQAGRFTFGFWLWRTGARGRFTTLEAALQYGGGTARTSYSWEPYFTLLDVTTCNVDRAIKESLVEGQVNPCRDLILLRAGIDDYRYLHTLETWIRRAEAKRPDHPALLAAKAFRGELLKLSLDLASYYDARGGSYGENWLPLPNNDWTGERFERTRRQAADHILALRKATGDP